MIRYLSHDSGLPAISRGRDLWANVAYPALLIAGGIVIGGGLMALASM